MEATFLNWLRSQIGEQSTLPLGLRDDAAVLQGIDRNRCVVTADLVADGVHFRLEEVAAQRVGRKALAVNLSDLAAMAARPVAAVVSLLLPANGSGQLGKMLYEGILELASEFEVAIAGGDTNTWSGPLVISITAIGELTDRGALTRGGASPGDIVIVTGSLGGSIESHHLDFRPRVNEALYLHETYELHAGMDISDGLALDLSRMAAASNCGAMLNAEAVPVSKAAHELCCCVANPQEAALQRALTDGEDFELLLAVAPQDVEPLIKDTQVGVPCYRIGTFIAQPGLWQHDGERGMLPLEARGYEHDEC